MTILIGFDTETSGPEPESARIVSACVGMVIPERGWVAKNWLIKQSEPIPQGAIDVHGITTEYTNEHGTDPAESLAQIRDDLYHGWEMGGAVVAYNCTYDMTVLDRDLRRNGLAGLDIRGPVLDPFVIDKVLDKWRRGSRKLIDTAAAYGIQLNPDAAHGAEADALAATRLAWKMLRHPDIAEHSPADLQTWQASHYAEQRRSFGAYLAKQGKTLDDSSTDWPIRPYLKDAA